MAQLSDDCFAFAGPLLPVDEMERLIVERVTPIAETDEVALLAAPGVNELSGSGCYVLGVQETLMSQENTPKPAAGITGADLHRQLHSDDPRPRPSEGR